MKIGLFFGSFNPIHKGHIAVAKHMLSQTDLQQIWLIVSPHNPLKDKNILADKNERFLKVKKVIAKYSGLKASKIEFALPQPSYTIKTLQLLRKKYPKHKFVIVMGSDNLASFHKWKSYKSILKGFRLYVYPRKSKKGLPSIHKHEQVRFVKAPLLHISSTQLRKAVAKGRNVSKGIA